MDNVRRIRSAHWSWRWELGMTSQFDFEVGVTISGFQWLHPDSDLAPILASRVVSWIASSYLSTRIQVCSPSRPLCSANKRCLLVPAAHIKRSEQSFSAQWSHDGGMSYLTLLVLQYTKKFWTLLHLLHHFPQFFFLFFLLSGIDV